MAKKPKVLPPLQWLAPRVRVTRVLSLATFVGLIVLLTVNNLWFADLHGARTGVILAIELAADGRGKTPFPASDRRGLRAYRHAIERGVVLRPLGDILYWMPPYCVGEEELLHLAAVTTSAIEEATRA